MIEEIEKKAMDKMREKLEKITPEDRGSYLHGWFDCLHLFSVELNKEEKSN